MHTYPAWKIWLVAIVMLVATLLALPNVFGEAPALQLSRNDRAAFTEQGQASVTAILAGKGLSSEAAHIEGDRLVLRFASVEQQLAARDAIQEAAPREHLIAFAKEPRTPAWMRALGLKPMSLGLDLRGGVYFLYEVDVAGAVKQLLSTMERDHRTLLRNERIPFTGIESNGVDSVRISLRTGADVERAVAALRKQDPNVTLDTGTAGEGGSVTVRLTPDQIKQRQDFAIQQNITTLRNRVDELGVTEPIVTRQGVDRIVVQLPGVQDPNEALRVLGATATLEFRLVDQQHDPVEAEHDVAEAPAAVRRLEAHEGGAPARDRRAQPAPGEGEEPRALAHPGAPLAGGATARPPRRIGNWRSGASQGVRLPSAAIIAAPSGASWTM